MVTDRSDWSAEDRIKLLSYVMIGTMTAGREGIFNGKELNTLNNCMGYANTHGEITDGYLEELIKMKNKIDSKEKIVVDTSAGTR